MKSKIKLGLILAVLCLALLWTTACDAFGGGGKEVVSQQLVKVTRGDLTVSVTGSGKIETSREARLTFDSAGKVASIMVKEGDKTRKGDVLAKLDTGALEMARAQAQLALTQAGVTLAQAQLAQKTTEHNLKNTKDTEDTLKLALLNAQISLDIAEDNLADARKSYDWEGYDAVAAALNKAKAYYAYALDGLKKATSENADNWALLLERAKDRLETAQTEYDNFVAGYSSGKIALKEKQVEAAEMAVALAQKNLDGLAEDISAQELQIASANQTIVQAQQSVKLAQLSLDEAQRQLDEATIIAPFDGVVAMVLVKEGDNIPSPTMAPKTVIQLIDPSRMELVVEVDEIDIPPVKLNQEAIISVDALPGVEFKGSVTAILPVPKEVSGVVLYDVRLSLEVPEDSGIRVGMSASADIPIDKRSNVLIVPSRAIQKDSQGRSMVKVMSGEQVQERPVVVGLDDGLRTEIISGLDEGETVVIESRVKSTSGMSLF